jgi:endonuclease V-like protein UPF0215 family
VDVRHRAQYSIFATLAGFNFILDCEQLKEVREPIIQEIDSLERLQIELEKNIRKCTTSATTEYNSINQKSEIKPSQCSKN